MQFETLRQLSRAQKGATHAAEDGTGPCKKCRGKRAEITLMMMTDNAAKIHFGPAQQQLVQGRSDLIRESKTFFFDMTPVASYLNRGYFRTRTWFGRDCFFSHSDNDALAVRRTKAQAESASHLVLVQRFLSGHLRGRLEDLNVDRHPGEIYLVDLERRYECIQFPSSIQNIFIPKSVLGYDPDRHAPFIHLSRWPTLGKLLSDQFDHLYTGLTSENALDPVTYQKFIACLRLAIDGHPKNEDVRVNVRAAMTALISRYIESHLEQWDLDVSYLLREFGVSRSSLYRMFEDKGGVRQYISDRRLFRAVADITRQPVARGEISRISEKWGFSSNANFSRAVKRRFGVAPGALLGPLTADRMPIEIFPKIHNDFG